MISDNNEQQTEHGDDDVNNFALTACAGVAGAPVLGAQHE